MARAFGQIADQRTGDAPDVDAVVFVECAVFGGDDGVADVFRQSVALDDGAVLLGECAEFRDSVVVVHGGVLRHGDLFGLRNLRGDVQIGEEPDACDESCPDQAENPFENEMLAAAFEFRSFAVGAMVAAAVVACGGRVRRPLPGLGTAVRATSPGRFRGTGGSTRRAGAAATACATSL